MNDSYLLDASILIQAFSKQDPKAIKHLKNIREKGKIYIPSIVIAEIGTGLTEGQSKIMVPLLSDLGDGYSNSGRNRQYPKNTPQKIVANRPKK